MLSNNPFDGEDSTHLLRKKRFSLQYFLLRFKFFHVECIYRSSSNKIFLINTFLDQRVLKFSKINDILDELFIK